VSWTKETIEYAKATMLVHHRLPPTFQYRSPEGIRKTIVYGGGGHDVGGINSYTDLLGFLLLTLCPKYYAFMCEARWDQSLEANYAMVFSMTPETAVRLLFETVRDSLGQITRIKDFKSEKFTGEQLPNQKGDILAWLYRRPKDPRVPSEVKAMVERSLNQLVPGQSGVLRYKDIKSSRINIMNSHGISLVEPPKDWVT